MAFEFVKRIFGRLPQPDPEDPDFYSYRQPSLSSLAAIPAAYAAIGLLSSTLGQLPRIVARLDDPLDDYWVPEPGHPVSELLRSPSSAGRSVAVLGVDVPLSVRRRQRLRLDQARGPASPSSWRRPSACARSGRRTVAAPSPCTICICGASPGIPARASGSGRGRGMS